MSWVWVAVLVLSLVGPQVLTAPGTVPVASADTIQDQTVAQALVNTQADLTVQQDEEERVRLRICKTGAVGEFQLNVEGARNNPVTVAVDADEEPECVRVRGNFDVGDEIDIQEAARAGFELVDVDVDLAAIVGGSLNLGQRRVTVRLAEGLNVVTFVNRAVDGEEEGRLRICKQGGEGTFTFRVRDREDREVTRVDVRAGDCVRVPGDFDEGDIVRVNEVEREGFRVTDIQIGRQGEILAENLEEGSARVRLGDRTRVTFVNEEEDEDEEERLRICKVGGEGTFTFRVRDREDREVTRVDVHAGDCVRVPGDFDEGDEFRINEVEREGFRVTDIQVLRGELLNENLEEGSARVRLGEGRTRVTFVNEEEDEDEEGRLRICKTGAHGTFEFRVRTREDDDRDVVRVEVNSDDCVRVPGDFDEGDIVRINEVDREGIEVTDIEIGAQGEILRENLEEGSARVRLGDRTRVTFHNRAVHHAVGQGELRVCKVAGTGVDVGEEFAFRVHNSDRHEFHLEAGAPEHPNCASAGRFAVGSRVTIEETRQPHGTQVAHVYVHPSGRNLDVDHNRATVRIESGLTTVTFVNVRPHGED